MKDGSKRTTVIIALIVNSFIFMIGMYFGEQSPGTKSFIIQGTYIIESENSQGKEIISIDRENNEYYTSLNGLTSVKGNYRFIDKNVIVFLDGMLENHVVMFCEDRLLLVNGNDASGITYDKENDQIDMHAVLIE